MGIKITDEPITLDFSLEPFNECINNLIAGWNALIRKNNDPKNRYTKVILKSKTKQCSFCVKNNGLYVIDLEKRTEKSSNLQTRNYGQINKDLKFFYHKIIETIDYCADINDETQIERFWQSDSRMAIILVLISEAARFEMIRYCILYSLYKQQAYENIETLNAPEYIINIFNIIRNQEYSLNERDPEILKFTNMSVLIHKYNDLRSTDITQMISFNESNLGIKELINKSKFETYIDICRLQRLGVLESPFRTTKCKYFIETIKN